jgi:hypothetical protein
MSRSGGRIRFPHLQAAIAQARAENPYLTAETKDRGHATVAAKLLPALFAGSPLWATSQSISSILGYACWDHDLLDHYCMFRRRFAKGPSNWGISAVVAQPYTRRDDLYMGAFERAAKLWAEHGVTACHAHCFSFWYPGWTTLVITARGIDAARARDLGFQLVWNPLQ